MVAGLRGSAGNDEEDDSGENTDDAEKPEGKVERLDSMKFKATAVVGCLWPVSSYREVFGSPKKGMAETEVWFNNQWHRGHMLLPDEGPAKKPVGVIELSREQESTLRKSETLADAARSVRGKAQVDEA